MQNGKYEGNCVKEVSLPIVSTPSEAEILFAKFDTNRDGFVSRYELQIGLEIELMVCVLKCILLDCFNSTYLVYLMSL